jgi:hypothetical protein
MRRIRPFISLAILAHAKAQDANNRQKRRLSATSNIFKSQSQAELFAHWTADKINSALPLDLKIDPRSGEGFIVRNDELISYAGMFAANKQQIVSSPDGAATLVKLSKVLDEESLEVELETVHVKKNRLGRNKHDRTLGSSTSSYTLDLASIEFKSHSFENQDRRLQTNRTQTGADGFVAMKKKPSKESNKNKVKGDKKKKDKDKGNAIKNKNEGGRKKKKKFLPKINELTPSRGDKISSSQTFSARVTPSESTESQIRDVSFRLVDPAGDSSDWLPVPNGFEEDTYEITIDGFSAFPASKWKYQMSVIDDEGRSIKSPNVMFKVDGDVEDELETQYDDYAYDEEEDAQGFADHDSGNKKEDLMEFDVVADSNWPYGGGIQSATGRILFEFDGSGTYVCSGTVVKDDGIDGRSVILVSGLCSSGLSIALVKISFYLIPFGHLNRLQPTVHIMIP